MIVQSVIPCGFLNTKPCIVIHPWTPHCRRFFFSNFRNSAIGSLGLFGTISVLKLALKIKKDGYELDGVLKTIKEILHSCAFTTLTISAAQSYVCIFRKALGRFTDFIILVPTIIASFFVIAERTEKWNLLMFMTGNCLLEYMLRSGMRSVRTPVSPRLLTILFMMTSAILLEILTRPHIRQLIRSGESAWIYYPTIEYDTKSQESNNIKHILHEIKIIGKLVGNGLGLQLAQIVLKNFTRPAYIFQKIFHFKTYKLGLFLGTYSLLFKIVHTIIQHLDKKKAKWHGMIAGFTAGVAISIYPDSFIAVMATTTLIQILCKLLYQKGYATRKFLWKYLFIIVSIGWLVHSYFVDPSCSPKWFDRTLEAAGGSSIKTLRFLLYKEWGAARFPAVLGGIY